MGFVGFIMMELHVVCVLRMQIDVAHFFPHREVEDAIKVENLMVIEDKTHLCCCSMPPFLEIHLSQYTPFMLCNFFAWFRRSLRD